MKDKTPSSNTQPSIIRSLFEYSKQRKAEIGADNVFDFSIGNPSVPTPEKVQDLLVDLIKNTDPVKLHGYTANSGLPEAKKAVADYLSKTYHTEIDENLVYITSGASPAIVFVIHALVRDGGEAIIFAPYFPEYTHYIDYAGGKFTIIKPDEQFLPDFVDFENKISPNTRLVIINSPNNPSGAFYNEEVIKHVCDILSKKEKEYGHPIYLLSDEPYRELLYTEEKYPFITNYYKDSLISYSFSKSLSLAGERIGYLVVNPKAENAKELYGTILHVGHNLGYVSTTSLFQYLLINTLGLTSSLDEYKQNRDLLYKNLTDIGFDVSFPEGAFYMLIKAPHDDAYRFSEEGKKFEIIMVPCDEFGIKGYVRLAYSVDRKTIVNSKSAFEKLYKYCAGDKHE